MPVIGADFRRFGNDLVNAVPIEDCPPVHEIFDVLPIFSIDGNQLTQPFVNIFPDHKAQTLGFCDPLQDNTIEANQDVRKFPFEELSSTHTIANKASDTLSSCRDPNGVQTQIAIQKILQTLAGQLEFGQAANNEVSGFLEQCDPNKVIDKNCGFLNKTDLLQALQMVTVGSGGCQFFAGNIVAELAFFKAHWVENFNVEFAKREFCCLTGQRVLKQVPKFRNAEFVRMDEWMVQPCQIGGDGEARRIQKIGEPVQLPPAEIVKQMQQGVIFSANLVVFTAGWNAANLIAPAEFGPRIFRYRETEKPDRSHNRMTVFLPINLAVQSKCSCAVIRDLVPAPDNIIVIPPNGNGSVIAHAVKQF